MLIFENDLATQFNFTIIQNINLQIFQRGPGDDNFWVGLQKHFIPTSRYGGEN